ncbi:adenylylsulfate kinase-like enzyme [Deinococcus yavapaiensis KR-236]|uniref:Adenylylsulfate kinase-like enzyme n=2 Tax=Deinococcus TaxID=1298 RepID=A0A318S827_9DEIO|nr:adenylylsulfate kinase-like enzyme [Deinococcus yavapaiensis KR-236]
MAPLYLVIGPPAVGKSTTSRALAARFDKSIHVPVDDLRHMVVSGLALPAAEWSDALTEQVALARDSAIAMAVRYNDAGFTVVLDDFVDFHKDEEYRALVDRPEFHRILLWPEKNEAHHRNLRRAGASSVRHYIDEGISLVYENVTQYLGELGQEGWIIIDNTDLSVELTVARIMEATLT